MIGSIDERIYFKICDTSTKWREGIRIGFSTHDPNLLKENLPNQVEPDLTRKTGFWAKPLKESIYKDTNAIIHFYVRYVRF